jgi:Ca-activated chloride channel family protein
VPARRLSRPLRALLEVLGLGLVLMAAHAGPAAAASDGRLVLVLDSSGSMQDRIDGGTKIAVAKRALNTVVDDLPADAQVGLRVYGARVDDENDPAACTDSELVVPIGPADKAALKDQIARYRPLGETPISYSLKQAAKDLGGSGRRTVVLVSDGRESCGEDPCVTAANLAKQGIDLKFDVIGLAVSGATRSQLQCIADKGRGTYADAKNAQQIEDSLDQLATRAFRPFQLAGTPVEGNEDPTKAAEVGPGQYLDQLPGRQDQKIWYRVPRTAPGSTFHVGITARSKSSTSAASVEIDTPDQRQCSAATGFSYQGLTSGGTTSWKVGPTNPCNTADHLLVAVYAPLNDLVGVDFELVVSEEAPISTDRHLPPVEKPTWQTMSATNVVKAPVAGLSVSDAPLLAPGAYSAQILSGETQVYAVDLDWGQRLQVQLTVAPRRGALARALSVGDTLRVQVLGDSRTEYTGVTASGQPEDTIVMDPDSRPYVDTAATPEIRYLNRTSFSASPGDVAGRQYVVLSKNRYTAKTPFLVPYTLDVAVIGTAGEGAPEYVVASPSPSPTPSDAPSTPPPSPPGAAGVPLGTVVGIGVGALVLGAAGAVVALTVRRRRRG